MPNAQTREWDAAGTYPEFGFYNVEQYAQATNVAGSLGGQTAGTPDTTATSGAERSEGGAPNAAIARSVEVAKRGNPIVAFLVALVVLYLAWWGMHKLEGDDGRRTFPFTAANAALITFQAALGIFVLKNVFTKFPVPGWTTVVQQI